jgi:acyl transferase domain-containing protein/acyl carrier protein
MNEFLDRISKLSPQRLALLADELNKRVRALEESRKVPLAIVGIGCRLPGGVQDAEGFWRLLSDGVDAVSQVPPSRWDVEEFYDANPETPGKMATRWGGFIDGHDQFDPKFFGIAPAEAASMDPQQRLLLETSWEALEHAGIAPAALSGTSTGVYVGICNGDYAQAALNSPREQITPHIAAGLSHAVAAGRISYVLGLRGPSLAVDTSCSASLVAVHLACQSLRLRECDAALAGGVNLILNPEVTIALSQSRMMAPDGKCKAFSDAANGFVRGEGCGMIVLKRLPDAVRDRNRILAVIRGSACNQDGRSSGLTAPNGPSQEAVITAALANAGLRADDIDYIEAHGTGTALGDPIELGALKEVFRSRSDALGPLLVGSVKTNLGHLESAAGIAGLIKLVLSIHHGKIPASLHLGTPNSRVEWSRLPVQVPTQLQEWTRAGGKRAGGVSSFGFCGTNAHVIVEEYADENRPGARQEMERSQAALPEVDRPLLFPLSAKTESALQQIALRLADHLREHPSLPLMEIARTLNTGRSHFEYRAAFVAASRTEFLTLLDGCAKNDASMRIDRMGSAVHSPRTAFAFGDEQTFEVNFARELYESAPVFRETLLRCGQILESEMDRPLLAQLYPEVQAANGRDGLPVDLRRPAAFALQFALAELWRSCGIDPAAVYGYGVGELVAASVAGVFSVEHGLRLAVAQGRSDQNEVARRVRGAKYSAPNITFVASGTEKDGIQVDSPDYWLRNSSAVVPPIATWNALAREGCAANLAIGDSTLLQSIRGTEIRPEGKWLASLGDGSGSCRQLLNTAAALYVMGFGVDMGRFYSDVVANTVALPTYPFERERYWISIQENRMNDVISSVSNDLSENIEVSVEDWIYELVWEPKPLPIRIPTRSAAGMEEETSETSSVAAAGDELARIASLNRAATPSQQTVIIGRAGLDEAKSARESRKEWLIFEDRLGIGDALAKSLKGLGKHCETIQRPDTPGEVSALLEKLRRRADNAELNVVYLWGVDAAGPIASAAVLQTGTEICGKTPIHLIQALQRSGKAARIFIVTHGAQATADFAPNAGGAVQSLAWGVGRVLGLESPERYGALIDVDPAMPPEAAATSVIAELFSNDREDQIVYRDGRRLVARLRRSSVQKSGVNTAAFTGLREDGAYLLVGGLGGVGLGVAKWAAEQHAGHLVLLGRTGIGANAGMFASERKTAIQQIEKLGTRVTIVEGDVASEADMNLLLRRFGGELPPLRGIFHAATVVHAAKLGDLTDERIDGMLRPKVLGTWILHELTKDLNLDFFLAFSSAASLLGAKGMAHYAAANQFLDSFAHFRRADGLQMLSVNWGAWNVMRLVSSQRQARLSQAGLLPMSSEKLFDLFGELLASRRAQIMIANIDWNILKPAFEVQRVRPLLEQLGGATPQQRSGNGSSIREPRRASLLDAAAMTPADRSKFIEAFVLEHAAQVLGFRRGELPSVDVPLSDLGLDSLMAVDLKNRLQTGLGQELSPTVVFDYPTVAALGRLLDTMLWAGDGTMAHDPASFHRDEIRI